MEVDIGGLSLESLTIKHSFPLGTVYIVLSLPFSFSQNPVY